MNVRRLLGGTRNWHEFAFHLHVWVAGCAEKHAPEMPVGNSTYSTPTGQDSILQGEKTMGFPGWVWLGGKYAVSAIGVDISVDALNLCLMRKVV